MCNETYEAMFPNEELSYFPENNGRSVIYFRFYF